MPHKLLENSCFDFGNFDGKCSASMFFCLQSAPYRQLSVLQILVDLYESLLIPKSSYRIDKFCLPHLPTGRLTGQQGSCPRAIGHADICTAC